MKGKNLEGKKKRKKEKCRACILHFLGSLHSNTGKVTNKGDIAVQVSGAKAIPGAQVHHIPVPYQAGRTCAPLHYPYL